MEGNEIIKWSLSAIVGLILSFFNKYGVLIIFVSGAVLLDILTGLIKGKLRQEINSRAAYIGFWKKIALFAGLGFGLFLDAVVQYALLSYGGQSLPSFLLQNIPFAHIIGIYIILNESISIVENLHVCGVKIPSFIVNMLRISKEDIDKGNEPKNK
jgi:toxin secretion/phage lysis holin